MRTFLLIITTALLTIVGIFYALTNNLFPEVIALLPLPNFVSDQASGSLASPTWADCTTPWWDTVTHGEVFLSFQDGSGTLASGGCVSKSTICNNGSRSVAEEPFPNKTCTLAAPENCEVNWFLFAHGTSQEFFKLDTKTQSCTSETRTCTDGTVDGDETFTYLSCPSSCPAAGNTGSWSATSCPECPCLEPTPEIKKPTTTTKPTTATTTTPTTIKQVSQPTTSTSLSEPNCPAPFGGTRREPGQQGTAYKQAVAPFGWSCEKVSIVCAFGSIRYGTKGNAWDIAVWVASSCTVGKPVACDSACGLIAHGEQTTTYKQAIIPHGNGQVCSDIQVVSTCTNGTLSPAGGSSCSCQVAPPAACTAPNGQSVAHGSSLTLYESAQVQAVAGDGADTCVRQWRQCTNGTFYDANGNAAAFTFKNATCTVIPPTGR